MADFVKVAKISEISEGKMTVVNIRGNDLAITTVNGKLYCIENNCSHQGGPLSEGRLEGKVVTCPWHNWKFDVTTGDSIHNPMANVNCFAVKVEGDDIWVKV